MASDRSVFMRPVVIDSTNKDAVVGGGTIALTQGTYPNVAAVLNELHTKVDAGLDDVILDGDCEAVGVADWSFDDATGAKDAVIFHGGTQSLKVTATAQVGAQIPRAYQSVLTIGHDYYILGYANPDGSPDGIVKVYDGTTAIWTGAEVGWQSFSVARTAVTTDISFGFNYAEPTGAEYVNFDDMFVYDLTDGCPVDFAPSFTSDFLVKFDATTDFAVTWTDSALRDLLGFTAGLSGDNTYTATYTPQGTWFPLRVRADNDEWYQDHKIQWKGAEARNGNTCGLRTGSAIYRTTLQYDALPDYECLRARSTTSYQDVRSLDYFLDQSREVYSAYAAVSGAGFYFFPDYTAVTIGASATYTSGSCIQFHRSSSPSTFVFCAFDADWYPKYKPTIKAACSDWFDVDIDIHTATAPTWTGA